MAAESNPRLDQDIENPNRFRLYGLKRLIAVVREAGSTLFGSAGSPPEAEERSAPVLDRRDRFTRDDI